MPTAYLNIGSNIGDRRSCLERAVACISHRWGDVRVSSPYESEPWGFDSPNLFLNIGVSLTVDDSETPLEFLGEIQDIERSISPASHRTVEGEYADRMVDVDIIAIDDMIMSEDMLELPHPRMHLREFVLYPMMEIAPDWVHPVLKKTCSQMLDAIHNDT